MKRSIILAAVMATTAACAAMPSGEAATVVAAAGSDMAPPAMEFVSMAGASDLYEIQSSQLLLQTSQNQDLRRFAQMMIDHHTMTTRTVTEAARSAGMTPPPPRLDPMRAEMIRQLQAAQGPARDALYVQQQVEAHRLALQLHGAYADNGDRPELRTAAATAVPVVSRHYNDILRMSEGQTGR